MQKIDSLAAIEEELKMIALACNSIISICGNCKYLPDESAINEITRIQRRIMAVRSRILLEKG